MYELPILLLEALEFVYQTIQSGYERYANPSAEGDAGDAGSDSDGAGTNDDSDEAARESGGN